MKTNPQLPVAVGLSLRLLAVCLAPFLMGCSSTNLARIIAAAGKDQAIVSGKITSIYGTVSYIRIGGTTNTITVAPDNTITVNK